ncbi:hypothetical protein SynPROS91_00162 [Synechococcus sp. PROS-9-1]|uniref:hypothetical protein n=1 Tax=Synechococcus sp. PROS-9-1 TaxID=1968775 RepID=UPI00164604C9|nr:hypothetical protein [Synechococcus sp. PROS-9-1]QNJ30590.1 hypothetical protein SynPROS91_00162 [Synechococcus sp. PROS-9-1]
MPNQDPPQSTLTLLLGIWGYLSRRRCIQLCCLLLAMVTSARNRHWSLCDPRS